METIKGEIYNLTQVKFYKFLENRDLSSFHLVLIFEFTHKNPIMHGLNLLRI